MRGAWHTRVQTTMATHFGTGLIETRGEIKAAKLEKAMDKAFSELGYKQLYAGKAPPEEEPEEGCTNVEILDNGDGVLAVRVAEEQPVRDVARVISSEASVNLAVLSTGGSLFGRRSVRVECRKFEVNGGEIEELPVVGQHTSEVTDIEHNELRSLDNALRSRIDTANDSLLAAEGSQGFKVKRIFRYKRERKKPKFSNARLGRLLSQLEHCESFEVTRERDQPVVKLVLPGNTKGMAFLKDEELAELEKALETRPELAHRRVEE